MPRTNAAALCALQKYPRRFSRADTNAAHPGGFFCLKQGVSKMSIQQLREKKAELAKQARNLHDQSGESWTAENTAKFDGLMDEVNRVDASIAREEQLMKLAGDKAIENLGGREMDGKVPSSFSNFLRKGEFQNTMSTTTGSEGGFSVQTDVAKELVQALKAYGGMRQAAQVLVTDKGNPMNYPTTNGTAEVGELIGENTTATDADAVFGSAALNVFKYSSKVITVPIELLQDSAVDVEALVRARLSERIGRITNQHFTVGTGSGQPNGIVTASGVGKAGLSGQTTSVIYDDLVDLQHSVDEAYRAGGKGKFMLNDLSLRNIRKIKDSNGRPLFVPGYDAGPAGAPDQLMGSDIIVNNDVAVMAANAKSILFGDFSYYIIRDALDIQLFRFNDSAYAKKGQVGFLAWFRSGGNFVDASGGAVKHYANSAT
jgi:HK97 family phage major capsid protein